MHGESRIYDMLRLDEGIRLKPYRDTKGLLTIGVGRNLDSMGISEDEAFFMLGNDVFQCKVELGQYQWFNALSTVRKDVILNMVFNLGLTRFLGFINLVNALANRDYDHAADEMLDSKWARTDVPARAKRLAETMRNGLYEPEYK